jgi:nucleoside-triphosphatase THEP1
MMINFKEQYERIGGKQLNERNEQEEVFGVEIVRVRQNRERVAYRVLQTSGRRTIGGAKEYSIEKLGDDKAFAQAKKEALKTVRGWK